MPLPTKYYMEIFYETYNNKILYGKNTVWRDKAIVRGRQRCDTDVGFSERDLK